MRYKIVGRHAIEHQAPGSIIEMEPDRAAVLVEAGHLEPVKAPSKDQAIAKGITKGTIEQKEGE